MQFVHSRHLLQCKIAVYPAEGEHNVRAESRKIVFGKVFGSTASVLRPVSEITTAYKV